MFYSEHMPAVTSQVSIEEYLRGHYDPDMDYLDGELEDRNVGELDHSDLQSEIVTYFRNRRRQCKCHAFVEQRLQIDLGRFRIPDVCVTLGAKPTEPIFRTPPFLCIEILSPEDRMARMRRKIADYLAFGVAYVWVIDPESKQGQVYTSEGITEPKDGVLYTSNQEIRLSLPEIFAALSESGS